MNDKDAAIARSTATQAGIKPTFLAERARVLAYVKSRKRRGANREEIGQALNIPVERLHDLLFNLQGKDFRGVYPCQRAVVDSGRRNSAGQPMFVASDFL